MINYITIGGITIDDTVSQNGQLVFGAAGGNSIYSAVGARLWSDGIGIVSRIGPDYPEKNIQRLIEGGVDVSGIIRSDSPSMHLWILYEQEGRRQIIFQKKSGKFETGLDPIPKQIPEPYLNAKMSHLSATGFNAQQEMAQFLYNRDSYARFDFPPPDR